MARITVPAIGFGILAVLIVGYFDRGFIPGGAFTYLAAGERLNAGHLLYALSPGDRPVDLNPPYWTVPFLLLALLVLVAWPWPAPAAAEARVRTAHPQASTEVS